MTIRHLARLAPALLIFLAPSPRLTAQAQVDKSLPPTVRVAGEGTVTVPPDMALLEVGVVTQGETAQTAAEENARRIDAVIVVLRRVLGKGGEIKTSGYTISPDYRYPKDGSKPTITGYSATNILEVRITDLQQVGKVLDSAAQGGANTIHSMRFGLKDERSAQTEALRQAVTNARAKADSIASAIGLHVIRVTNVEESGPLVRPVYNQALAMGRGAQVGAPPTPVEPGSIELRATVTLTVEVGP